ncbi:MAG: AIR carboxylase family protein, partial [Cryobacterium sp.]|nr:AIR carboxylase family protein [Cryobacterium sp.]
MPKPLVAVVMGSDSDWAVMQDAVAALKQFDIPFEVEVLSAHRTPEKMIAWGKAAASRGLKCIIA